MSGIIEIVEWICYLKVADAVILTAVDVRK
jgi:hypothetical protein